MFSISIAIGPLQWRLLYKTSEAAEKAWSILLQPVGTVQLEDDFGQRVAVLAASITGKMFEDMNQSKLANVELMLFNAAAQMAAQKRAQTDPAFRAASTGPAIVSPMPGNRFNS